MPFFDCHFSNVTKFTNLEISLCSNLHLVGQLLYFMSHAFNLNLQAFCEILMRLNKGEIFKIFDRNFQGIENFFFSITHIVFKVEIGFSS